MKNHAGVSLIMPGSPDDSITGLLEQALDKGRLMRETLLKRASELLKGSTPLNQCTTV